MTRSSNMPRKFQVFVTNLGFFELAIAAPSMKAALDAWGMNHNAFAHGFAKKTDDAAIVEAAMAHPGTVVKRAVGSKGAFKPDTDMPDKLPAIAPKLASAKTKPAPKAKPRPKTKPEHKSRAVLLSFQAAKEKRDRQRAREEERRAAQAQKQLVRIQQATEKAQAALEDAAAHQEKALAAMEREQEKLEDRARKEKDRWNAQRRKLQASVDAAG